MTGSPCRRLLLSIAALACLFAIAPASASALCNGMAATVGGATGGNDTLTGTAGADVIEGLGGNDTIDGLGGNDTICGDDGDDTIDGGLGNDSLFGGANTTTGDTVTFASTPTAGSPAAFDVIASLLTGTATVSFSNPSSVESETFSEFENLTGSNTFDSLTGNGSDNVIAGLDRADNLTGLGGNDALTDPLGGTSDLDTAHYESSPGPGGINADIAAGTVDGTAAGAGADTLTGVPAVQGSVFADVLAGSAAVNQLLADSGNDLIMPRAGTNDFVNGGSGSDTVSYSDQGVAIAANLAIGTSTVTGTGIDHDLFQVENLTGTPQGDQISGDGNANVLDGLGGDDALSGAGGTDTASFGGLAQSVDANLVTGVATGQGTDTLATFENLTGSSQGDFLTGDGGGNVFNGNGGSGDTVRFSGVAQGVIASLVGGTASGQGDDTLSSIDNLTGSSEDDTLTGDANANVLLGLDGADAVTGGLGADTLLLGAGLDVITANDGVVDAIDCEGGGPDSGSVDGPAPAETYTDCDSDGDALVDFLDVCPTEAASSTDGCVPTAAAPPGINAGTTAKKKKCKKGFKLKKVKGKKKCVRKKKRR